MGMETNLNDFRSELNKLKGIKNKKSSYSEAFLEINEYIQQDALKNVSRSTEMTITKKDNNKPFYREIKEHFTDKIREAIRMLDISVYGYESNIEKFIEELSENYVGYHILSDAFKDDEITDIFVINHEFIFAEKDGKNIRLMKDENTPLSFKSKEDLKETMDRLLQYDSKIIDSGENKIVDSTLFGDRINSIHPVIASKGYAMTIRKHQEDHITREDLINSGTLTPKIAEFFHFIIDGELNIICGGITGSGKTTSLRAICEYTFEMNGKRVLVAEDTPELNFHAEHVLALQSYYHDDPKQSVPLMEIIYAALRQKPKHIVIGEVRGKETVAAIEAMETGHCTILSMHGGEPINIVNRTVTKFMQGMNGLGIEVVERIIGSAVDYIFIQDNIPGTGRRISSCVEVSYDFKNKLIDLKEMFYWDFKDNEYKWSGLIAKSKANTMMRRGIKYNDVKHWIEED